MSTKSITVVTLNPRPTLIHQLKALLMEAKQSPSDIVLDLSSIDVLETDELELLLTISERQSHENQRMVFCGVANTIRETRKWLDLDRAFKIVSDQETAMALLTSVER